MVRVHLSVLVLLFFIVHFNTGFFNCLLLGLYLFLEALNFGTVRSNFLLQLIQLLFLRLEDLLGGLPNDQLKGLVVFADAKLLQSFVVILKLLQVFVDEYLTGNRKAFVLFELCSSILRISPNRTEGVHRFDVVKFDGCASLGLDVDLHLLI